MLGLSPKFFESICSLRKSRISKFLDSFIQTLIMIFLFLPYSRQLNHTRKNSFQLVKISSFKAQSLVSTLERS